MPNNSSTKVAPSDASAADATVTDQPRQYSHVKGTIHEPGQQPWYQPGYTDWAPTHGSSDLKGLEVLAGVEKLEVKQKLDLLEAALSTVGMGCCEKANMYFVYDANAPIEYKVPNAPGHLLTIQEDFKGDFADICCRCCCNPFHKMTLTATEMKNKEVVFKVDRPFKGCGWACFPCCLQQWSVLRPDDTQIGAITQPCCGGGFCPKFNAKLGKDPEAMEAMWDVTGKHCQCELCCDTVFQIFDAKEGGQETPVGEIWKPKPPSAMDLMKELLTDADNLLWQFPKDATGEQKAIALTTLVMLDYYFFEFGGGLKINPCPGPGEYRCELTLCNQFCCGTICPWTCACCQKGEEGEAGEDAEDGCGNCCDMLSDCV